MYFYCHISAFRFNYRALSFHNLHYLFLRLFHRRMYTFHRGFGTLVLDLLGHHFPLLICPGSSCVAPSLIPSTLCAVHRHATARCFRFADLTLSVIVVNIFDVVLLAESITVSNHISSRLPSPCL